MVVFWIFIILGIVALVKWIFGMTSETNDRKKVRDILQERYAKGEISKKEFEEKFQEIKNL